MHLRNLAGGLLTIVVALIVVACSSGSQAGASSGSGVAANGATISITAPANGAEVTVPFAVKLDSTVPLGEPETGDHHAHLYFDTSTDAADYDIVYGTSSQVTRPLEPGQHTITVALANPDHSLAGPTQSITVTVTGSAPAGSPAGASPPPSTAPGYDY